MKGSSVYITAEELAALHDVTGYLSALLEGVSGDATHLIAAKSGLHSVIDKAERSKRMSTMRLTIKAAIRSAED